MPIRCLISCVIALLVLIALAGPATADTFVVDNAMDSGAGSLRQAMLDAEATGGADIIDATGAAGTIPLVAALPTLTEEVEINGPTGTTFRADGDDANVMFTIDGAMVTIRNMTFQNGFSTDITMAAGITVINAGTLIMEDCVIDNCQVNPAGGASAGGGLQASGGSVLNLTDVTIQDCSVNSGDAAVQGGGIWITGGSLTMDTCIVDGCDVLAAGQDNAGGGIYANASNLDLTDTTITDCEATQASSFGAGMALQETPLMMSGGEIADCTASGLAGGVYFTSTSATATFEDVRFRNCTGQAGGGVTGLAGTLLDFNRCTIDSCTATGLVATVSGGAIATAMPVSMVNCTVSGNMATDAASAGGGIVLSGGSAAVDLTHCTVTGNSAVNGGGIVAGAGTLLTIKNTIVAANTASGMFPDVVSTAGTVASEGGNLIGDGTGITDGITHGVNGDMVGTGGSPIDPVLGALALNGGVTPTHLPDETSPVFDAGVTGGTLPDPVEDQRELVRPADSGVPDTGSVESPGALAFTLAAASPSGTFAMDNMDLVVALFDPQGGAEVVVTGVTIDLVFTGDLAPDNLAEVILFRDLDDGDDFDPGTEQIDIVNMDIGTTINFVVPSLTIAPDTEHNWGIVVEFANGDAGTIQVDLTDVAVTGGTSGGFPVSSNELTAELATIAFSVSAGTPTDSIISQVGTFVMCLHDLAVTFDDGQFSELTVTFDLTPQMGIGDFQTVELFHDADGEGDYDSPGETVAVVNTPSNSVVTFTGLDEMITVDTTEVYGVAITFRTVAYGQGGTISADITGMASTGFTASSGLPTDAPTIQVTGGELDVAVNAGSPSDPFVSTTGNIELALFDLSSTIGTINFTGIHFSLVLTDVIIFDIALVELFRDDNLDGIRDGAEVVASVMDPVSTTIDFTGLAESIPGGTTEVWGVSIVFDTSGIGTTGDIQCSMTDVDVGSFLGVNGLPADGAVRLVEAGLITASASADNPVGIVSSDSDLQTLLLIDMITINDATVDNMEIQLSVGGDVTLDDIATMVLFEDDIPNGIVDDDETLMTFTAPITASTLINSMDDLVVPGGDVTWGIAVTFTAIAVGDIGTIGATIPSLSVVEDVTPTGFPISNLNIGVTGEAVQLVFITQPVGSVSGNPFAVQPVLEFHDVNSNVATSIDNVPVTASIALGDGGTVIGTKTVTVNEGIVIFSDVGIQGAGTYLVRFSQGSGLSAVSNPVTITAAPGDGDGDDGDGDDGNGLPPRPVLVLLGILLALAVLRRR